MLTKIDDRFVEAIQEFEVGEVLTSEDLEEFEEYLDERRVENNPKLVIRFLIERLDDAAFMLAYMWVVWVLDSNGTVQSLNMYLPDNPSSWLDTPPDVLGAKVFHSKMPMEL